MSLATDTRTRPTDTASRPHGPSGDIRGRKRLKAYLDLCRVSNLPTVWTNVLAALVVSGASVEWGHFLALAVSMSLFYSGGMCLNDICDLTRDRSRKAFRPIPSGRISLRKASIFTGILFALGIGGLGAAPFFVEAIPAGLLLLGIILAYDKLHAERPWTVFLMAGSRFMVYIVCGLAVTGKLEGLVLLGGVAQFIYVVVVSVVARYENARRQPFAFPVIPVMIAAISLLDGALMALLAAPAWAFAGFAGAVLTHFGQRFVRGD